MGAKKPYIKPTITKDQLEIVMKNYMTQSRETIAKMCGITTGKLNSNMQYYGIRRNPLAAKTCSEVAKPGMFDEKEYIKTLYKY